MNSYASAALTGSRTWSANEKTNSLTEEPRVASRHSAARSRVLLWSTAAATWSRSASPPSTVNQ